MKSKILPLALLSIFLFVLLIIGHPLIFPDREAMGLDAGKERDVIVIYEPEDFSPGGLEAVARLISDVQKELSSFSRKKLNERDIAQIGEFYGAQGVLTAHDGFNIIGGKDIYCYFESHRDDITNLKFKLECVYAKELTHILNLKLKDKRDEEKWNKDIVHVAYLIISVSFDLNGKRIDPGSGTNRKHIRVCDWEI